jgi:glycopeptide antibiotics resistance protein
VIITVLVDHPWLSPTALALMVVLGPVLGSRLVPHPRLAWWLTGLTLVPVAVLTLVPVDRELFARCTVQWTLPTPGRVELMANLVLFVAPALLAGIASRRPLLAVLAGSALSAVVEAGQALVPAIGRSCDTNDWLSNTLGAVVGGVLALVALRLASVRSGDGVAFRPLGDR